MPIVAINKCVYPRHATGKYILPASKTTFNTKHMCKHKEKVYLVFWNFKRHIEEYNSWSISDSFNCQFSYYLS